MNAYCTPAILIAIGSIIFAYGSRFPEFNDPHAEAQLHDQSWFDAQAETINNNGNDDAVDARWYALRAKLQTRRDACYDVGAGIIALGIGLLVLFSSCGIRSMDDLRRLASPRSHRRFYLMAALTWLSFIPAEWCYYIYTFIRGDYPPTGDIIAIPCMGVLVFGVLGLPIVLFGVWIAIHGTTLPVSLWSGPVFRRFNFASLGVWIALILAVLVTAMGVATQPPIVPSAVFTIYLLLSGKAAAEQPAIEPWGLPM